jgi:putative membrane protein
MPTGRLSHHDAITMDELPERARAATRPVVLDVRSRLEFLAGHVPSAVNAPLRALRRSPSMARDALLGHDAVFVHCTRGVRAARAVEILRQAGLDSVVLVRDSGFPEWRRAGRPVERGRAGRSFPVAADPRSLPRALLAGVGIGLAATLASGIANAGLSLLVGDEPRRRERRVRRGSPHEVGGALVYERLRGRAPAPAAWLGATLAFSAVYSTMWGTIYTLLRRVVPSVGAGAALPLSAAAFFVACDGGIAPSLRLTPGLRALPWQVNAKELANHMVWNATAEALHRADARSSTGRAAR